MMTGVDVTCCPPSTSETCVGAALRLHRLSCVKNAGILLLSLAVLLPPRTRQELVLERGSCGLAICTLKHQEGTKRDH